ncbi:MAG: hypothetical protein J6T02_01945 [Bacteroidales bacterium]|nr:hypothetical protein [Bacteroidales bacterium]
MKAWKVLLFICGVLALFCIGWAVFPAEGIEVGDLRLKFASLERSKAEADESKMDVDSLLRAIDGSFLMDSVDDTLSFYKKFFTENADRIHLPGNDYRFFDDVFADFERAEADGKLYRIKHYGDSQLEMDRISSVLRQGLQERFGGIGTGMFPALSNVPSSSVNASYSGGMVHYTMYGDSTTVRAPHTRYGPMAQLTNLYGPGTVTMRVSTASTVKPLAMTFSRVSVLAGRFGEGFKVSVKADTLRPEPVVLSKDTLGAALVSFDLGKKVKKAVLSLGGSCEIYGVYADGSYGVAVDNIPLRGCSGTIFTRINPTAVARGLELDGTRIIILQFGGNYMPVTKSQKNIDQYTAKIAEQIKYFHSVAPDAKIIFIGPSDMGRSVGGRIQTWPFLPEMVEALRKTALENGAAFWDIFHMMGGENSMARWVAHRPPYAGPDYIHFTTRGSDIVGDAFTRSLLIYYDFYTLRKSLPQAKVESYMRK